MAVPDIVKTQQAFNKKLDQLDATSTARLAKEWLKIEEGLSDDVFALAKEVEAIIASGKTVDRKQLIKLRRYIRLIVQIQQEIERYSKITGIKSIEAIQKKGALSGLKQAAQYLAEVTQIQTGVVTVAFDQLGVKAIENLVAIAQAGQPLNVLLNNAYPLAVEGITSELLSGLARGINPRDVADIALRKGFANGLNHILLVSRDQMIRSYREASRQQYAKSKNVKAYRRLAAKDDRTCPACLALDGKIYPTDKLMEVHPQDRCAMIPIVRGFEPVKIESGQQWFDKQSQQTQEKILGKGRLEALQAGKFTFDKLATSKPNKTWGATANPTSLKDLLAGKGGVK